MISENAAGEIKMMAHSVAGVSRPSHTETIKALVPQALHTLPMPQASIMIISTSIMEQHPWIKVLTASWAVMTLDRTERAPEITAVMKNAMTRERRLLPSAKEPTKPLAAASPV